MKTDNLQMSILKTSDSEFEEYITIQFVRNDKALTRKYLTMGEYGQMISGEHNIKLRDKPPNAICSIPESKQIFPFIAHAEISKR
jgi:hypothetical protein